MLSYFLNFAGRFGRKEYILRSFVLGFTVVVISFLISGILFLLLPRSRVTETLWAFAAFAIFLVFTLGMMANVVRRWHDLNHSTATGAIIGLMDAGCFIAELGNSTDVAMVLSALTFIPNCLLIFKRGTIGDNEYGPDPLQGEMPQEAQEPGGTISTPDTVSDNSNTIVPDTRMGNNATVDSEGRIVISSNRGIREDAVPLNDTGAPAYVVGNKMDSLNGREGASNITLDDLPKLKKMLDEGVITQEEFDAAKKKILY